MWIARDKNGDLNCFINKPVLLKEEGIYKDTPNSKISITDNFTLDSYEYIAFGDAPKQVTLISYDSLSDIIEIVLRKTKIPIIEQSEIFSEMLMHNFYLNY